VICHACQRAGYLRAGPGRWSGPIGVAPLERRDDHLPIITRRVKAAVPLQRPNCRKSFALIGVYSRTDALSRLVNSRRLAAHWRHLRLSARSTMVRCNAAAQAGFLSV
jgi:hypothetical protein